MVLIVPYSAKLLHRKVLTAAMRAKMSFFVSTDTGEIVNRFSQDMTLVVWSPTLSSRPLRPRCPLLENPHKLTSPQDMQLPMSFMMAYSSTCP